MCCGMGCERQTEDGDGVGLEARPTPAGWRRQRPGWSRQPRYGCGGLEQPLQSNGAAPPRPLSASSASSAVSPPFRRCRSFSRLFASFRGFPAVLCPRGSCLKPQPLHNGGQTGGCGNSGIPATPYQLRRKAAYGAYSCRIRHERHVAAVMATGGTVEFWNSGILEQCTSPDCPWREGWGRSQPRACGCASRRLRARIRMRRA